MGITGKLITKNRTKPVTGPVGITGDWDKQAELAAAAIIRAVAANLGNKGLESSSFRGKEVLGIGSMTSRSDSTIWVRQLNPRTWEITVGRAIINYDRSIDWQLTAAVVDGPLGRTVEITTGAYSTKDDALMNQAAFLETRDFLLAGFAQGFAKSNANELQIDSASLPVTATAVMTAKAEFARGSETIRTSLTLAQIEGCLGFLPNMTLERGGGRRRVRLGFGHHADEAQIDIVDAGQHHTITVSRDIADGDDPLFHDRKIFDGVGLPYRVLALVRTLDEAAEVLEV